MSVTDRDPRFESHVDLDDLGTIAAADLDAARDDAELQAESRAARDAVEALERNGRLIIG